LVFAADLNGKAYAFHSENGKVLWLTTLDGAAAGGIITYSVKGKQRVAIAVGLTSPVWPVAPKGKTAKIVVFGVS
jgi:alcohol dehydrogenase (cytochrome c)